MKDLINKLYKNHSLIYKALLFVATTFLIVYLFPKSGKFKYNFEKGKPWQSENLYAPFDFAVKKADKELQIEEKTITENASPYFDVDLKVIDQVNVDYGAKFNIVFSDSLGFQNKKQLLRQGAKILKNIYTRGVLDENYNYSDDKQVVVLEDRKQKENTSYSKFIKQNDLRTFIEDNIEELNLSNYELQYLSLLFDVIKPNVSLNDIITDTSLQEELDKISLVRGNIEKETLIISKGEVVEGDKFEILKSLQAEYESQIWTEANYNWILAAYTLLVALALLMLLLFLRKYRLEVFKNNTKVTFIFFNILLMVFLTTRVVN
jgi:cyclic-di-AMP phosphodiesterase PgpH